jgi:6-phosphogluconolactonase
MIRNLSRREFVAITGTGLLGSVVSSTSQALGHSSPKLYAYVSSWTAAMSRAFGFSSFDGGKGGGGIHVFTVDMKNGSLTHLSSVAPEMNTGYICIAPNGRFLYATDERKDYGGKAGAGGGLSTLSIDPADGSLTCVNSHPSMGAFPAYICIDATGSRVVTANHGSYDNVVRIVRHDATAVMEDLYDDGIVAMFPVEQSGTLGTACDVSVLQAGHGPGGVLQGSSHPHSVNFDPSNRFLLACDKGADRIYVYRFDPGSRTLGARQMFSTPPGTAPRHSAFHPRLPYVFIVNELEASLTSFSFDSTTGEIRSIETVATVAAGLEFRGQKNMPADIRIHPNGKFLYGSTRGNNSIAIFQLDEATGKLTPVDIVPTGGSTPRAFNFEPSGKYLFAANQESNNIITFAVDSETGKISQTAEKVEIERPVCLKFAVL